MNKILTVLLKVAPFCLKRKLDLSNHPFLIKLRAKRGLMTVKCAKQIIADSGTSAVACCPLCTRAIKPGELVVLYSQDMTPIENGVRIKRAQTLFVPCLGIKYQVGCFRGGCERLGPDERVGILNSLGQLSRYSPKMSEHIIC